MHSLDGTTAPHGAQKKIPVFGGPCSRLLWIGSVAAAQDWLKTLLATSFRKRTGCSIRATAKFMKNFFLAPKSDTGPYQESPRRERQHLGQQFAPTSRPARTVISLLPSLRLPVALFFEKLTATLLLQVFWNVAPALEQAARAVCWRTLLNCCYLRLVVVDKAFFEALLASLSAAQTSDGGAGDGLRILTVLTRTSPLMSPPGAGLLRLLSAAAK